MGKPSKSPDRTAGTGTIFEPGTYRIRNTGANRSTETQGSRFIEGPPCTIIYYANTTAAQNVCYFVTRSCPHRWLPDFPNKILPSTIPISRTLVQLRWRENVPSKSWKPSNDSSHFISHMGLILQHTRCVRKVMTLNAWLDNWQCCSHTSDTRRDIHSYLIRASFNSIALTRLI